MRNLRRRANLPKNPQPLKPQIEKILPNVRKPAQYIGNELNSVHKDWSGKSLSVAIGYPDLYEVGMSNLGIQILYNILNNEEDIVAERFFAPKQDMADELKREGLPLFSLESMFPLKDFDMLGFSIGHELNYTNILSVLELSGIPFYSKDRGEGDPLIFGGGPAVFNPYPIEDFFDFFLVGDGEEAIKEIADCVKKGGDKKQKIESLSKIEGVYVPILKNRVVKRYVKDLENAPYPTKPIVAFIEAVHDRAVIEIMRGCKRACKFCSAFCSYKPVRERSPEKVISLAEEIIKNTGYEEISLISLSSSDYSKIEYLAIELAKKFEGQKINIALPSLRLDSLGVKIMKEIQRVRPSSVTVAPEAGTQRLRDFVRKNLTEEQILSGAEIAFSEGITSIKLYFMIGLPTETREDIEAIALLAKKVMDIGKKYSKRARVSISASTFIPKPHTPLERERQINLGEILERQKILKDSVRNTGVELKWHDSRFSIIEGVFSRGDARLSKVIEDAYKLGARMDAWTECFNFEVWEKAFLQNGLSFDEYLRERDEKEELPWNNIIC